ncbi:DUF1624 domain-containing protein [Clostridiales bacterium]|nr:DUF1624 domain-containing protein [Clostridiales bacterium]
MTGKRYAALDGIRGIALFNMLLYHAVWDLVHLFGFDWLWYQSQPAYIWQQSICWTFIFLSGFCQPLGRSWQSKLKRGGLVFLAGLFISAATALAAPESLVLFGILTLIGSCMMLFVPLEFAFKKCPPTIGLTVSFAAFLLTKNINQGYLGLDCWNLAALPERWYHNWATAYLGLPAPEFHSTDYFPLLPWACLFAAGYFLYQIFAEKELLHHLESSRMRPVEWLGRHSLIIYMIHQPVLYLLLSLLLLPIQG